MPGLGGGTVVGVVHVDDVEVGVVDGRGGAFQSHFVLALLFAVEGGFGDVEEGVHQRSLAGVFGSQDHQRAVAEFALGTRFVQQFRPHLLYHRRSHHLPTP